MVGLGAVAWKFHSKRFQVGILREDGGDYEMYPVMIALPEHERAKGNSGRQSEQEAFNPWMRSRRWKTLNALICKYEVHAFNVKGIGVQEDRERFIVDSAASGEERSEMRSQGIG